jgi:hypothetical protein
MHWGHDGTTLRPDEGFNELADNFNDGQAAFELRHRVGGGHNDQLVARALIVLEWDADTLRFNELESDPVVAEVTSSATTPGEAVVRLRQPVSPSLWCKATARTSTLGAGAAAVQLSPNRILIQTFLRSWSGDNPALTAAGFDVSLEVKW